MGHLTMLPAWQALRAHYDEIRSRHLRDLFTEDPERAKRYTLEAAGLFLDYSKNRLNDQTLEALFNLARERGVEAQRDAMLSGAHINTSEDRAVLHTALRAPRDAVICANGHNVVPDVHKVLDHMGAFAQAIRSGAWRGFTGQPIRHIINIGIGGSFLGPQLVYEALKPYALRGLTCSFVANIDGAELANALQDKDPAETLFVIASKTFTTLETLTNAQLARDWLVEGLGAQAAVARHCVAVSVNVQAAVEFGIDANNIFGFWDWVGGRYSVESAIGLTAMVAIGGDLFAELLAGSRAMDEHFQSAPLGANMPVIMGLISLWYNNFFGAQTVAILPYAHALARLPAYLQQLAMESNGKRVDARGELVEVDTGPIVWGEPGVDGQHSFHQLLYQGTRLVPCDMIGFMEPLSRYQRSHDLLMASLFAQAEALAFGRTGEQLRALGVPPSRAKFEACEGNRPTNMLLGQRLDARTLGALIALYEHSVFVQGAIWGVDSFDQWGVELGKDMARHIIHEIETGSVGADHDPSTRRLLARYMAARRAGQG